jgi:hypothetical protein
MEGGREVVSTVVVVSDELAAAVTQATCFVTRSHGNGM